ncbi:MAG: hypothetical protein IPJ82_08395 [Lewinellaceae bacterium]|nr:hypothetical protein [Lewinellaceae bacterium]
MKNLPIILNIILFALVAHLYYLNLKKPQQADQQSIIAPSSASGGARIAYVNGDTLDAQYEWLKQQKKLFSNVCATRKAALPPNRRP